MLIRKDFNTIYIDLIWAVFEQGIKSAPRNIPIKEILSYQFHLTDPTKCLCTLKDRKLNYAFAIIEKMEYLTGVNIPERLCFYNKNMSGFVNELTGQFDGAYAPRFGRQLKYIGNLLSKDPDSRQAVININNETDNHESKDVACTISLQFFNRDNKLHLIASMRSNDVLWGTPYDVNAFCFIQEVMAKWLKLGLGSYYHHAGSMHIYESTAQKLRDLANYAKETNNYKNPKWDIVSMKETYEQLAIFWFYENQFRNGNITMIGSDLTSKALREYLKIIKDYCIKKHERLS